MTLAEAKKEAPYLCDVHEGIGGDGVVVYDKGKECDFDFHIINRDGTEAEMCGNALRCLIRHNGEIGKKITVMTKAGIKSGVYNGTNVSINLSKPVSFDTDPIKISYNGMDIEGKRINVGNPHFVIERKYDEQLAEFLSECREFFPDRTNVEFVTYRDDEIFMRVYERGCGETMACGTGAAAAFIAGGKNSAVVHLIGGTLKCRLNDDGEIIQTGKAVYNYQGEWSKCLR